MTNPVATDPSPALIFQEIDALLPFEREAGSEKYLNLPVLWRVMFMSIRREDKGWRIATRFNGPGRFPPTAVGFRLSAVPEELKVAPADSAIWVQGEIATILYRVVVLQNPEVLKVESS